MIAEANGFENHPFSLSETLLYYALLSKNRDKTP
jgi:hypothetical protein